MVSERKDLNNCIIYIQGHKYWYWYCGVFFCCAFYSVRRSLKNILTRYCIAIDRLRGPGGPMRNTSWPKRSFCIIQRRCWTTAWGRDSETGKSKGKKYLKNLLNQLQLFYFFYFIHSSYSLCKRKDRITYCVWQEPVLDSEVFWVCMQYLQSSRYPLQRPSENNSVLAAITCRWTH